MKHKEPNCITMFTAAIVRSQPKNQTSLFESRSCEVMS